MLKHGAHFGWRQSLGVFLVLVMIMSGVSANVFGFSVPSTQAAPVPPSDIGKRDISFDAPSVGEPTSQKPQSKLWYTPDNIWWGSLFNTTTDNFEIYRYNGGTDSWTPTGGVVDTRNSSLADTLWDGTHLYIASAVVGADSADPNAFVSRFSYNSTTKIYTLDSGFPVAVGRRAMKAIVLDKDSTGRLWVTFTQAAPSPSPSPSPTYQVYVNHSGADDLTWGLPYIPAVAISGATAVVADDISAIVAVPGSHTVELVWSNQTDPNNSAFYYALHRDIDAPDAAWSAATLLPPGSSTANDHINLKSLQVDATGHVFIALKTQNYGPGTPGNTPLVQRGVDKPVVYEAA